MNTPKPNKNSVALAGEFATLSQLALSGYDANLTLGNTKHVDILVSDPGGTMYRLEVKTTFKPGKGNGVTHSKLFGKCYQWMMGEKHESIVDPSLFYCFVNITGSTASMFEFFVVPSGVVAEYVREQHRFWLNHKPNLKDTPMRVFRLGVDDPGTYELFTPAAAQYENNWGFHF